MPTENSFEPLPRSTMVFRSLDFPSRRHHEHKETRAFLTVPSFPDSKRVLEHHLVTVWMRLDGFGIADPIAFAAQIQKAG